MPNKFEHLADKWPSAWVERSLLWEFSGGLIHPHSMRNYDSRGCGIENKTKIGRKVAYPVADVINWLNRRCEHEASK